MEIVYKKLTENELGTVIKMRISQLTVETYLSDYFSTRLACGNINVLATYGIPSCMLPEDVKTVEDVFAKCDNMEVYVSTFGLESDSYTNGFSKKRNEKVCRQTS
ncbi:MAG: hypothetical protein K6E16_10090 [Lachnospiraceae bacterium]|nr:hypothetical protein [Lachnospiraceae bacterium]